MKRLRKMYIKTLQIRSLKDRNVDSFNFLWVYQVFYNERLLFSWLEKKKDLKTASTTNSSSESSIRVRNDGRQGDRGGTEHTRLLSTGVLGVRGSQGRNSVLRGDCSWPGAAAGHLKMQMCCTCKLHTRLQRKNVKYFIMIIHAFMASLILSACFVVFTIQVFHLLD